MTEFQIETNSPLIDLRAGDDFSQRANTWLLAAHELVSDAITTDRQFNPGGEEVELLMTNRKADHLAMGLALLASHFATVAAA